MKPIIFNTEMICRILDGTKTQTRRIVKPQPPGYMDSPNRGHKFVWWDTEQNNDVSAFPEYNVGDVLYVRETFFEYNNSYYYKADNKHLGLKELGICFKWKPSIHMPKAATRIYLQVTGVKAERLQDITPYDACCEGILVGMPPCLTSPPKPPSNFESWGEKSQNEWFHGQARMNYIAQCDIQERLIREFAKTWNNIYGKGNWGRNEWVYAYTFKQISKEEAYAVD